MHWQLYRRMPVSCQHKWPSSCCVQWVSNNWPMEVPAALLGAGMRLRVPLWKGHVLSNQLHCAVRQVIHAYRL